MVIIQIEEGKTYGGILQKPQPVEASPALEFTNDGIVPSQRRISNRRPSLLVSVNDRDPATAKKSDSNEEAKTLESLNSNDGKPVTFENERRDSLAGVSFDPNTIYEPPAFALIHQDTNMPPPVVRDRLEVDEFPLHTISTAWIKMMTQGLSEWIKLPVIVCRGTKEG